MLSVKHGFSRIIHLAAETTLSTEFNPKLFESNIVYAKEVMGYGCKTVYASSTSAAELSNPYAYTKRYLEWLGERHGNAVGLRFFNVYGPGNNKGIIKRLIECAQTGETITISGGNQVRDFIYVDDVVKIIIQSLDWEPGIYEIGTGIGHRICDVVDMVSDLSGREINVTYTDANPIDMEYSVANPGFTESISLKSGIIKMLS